MVGPEEEFVNFILNTQFGDLPKEALTTAEHMVVTIIGTMIAGATLEGVDPLRDQIRQWGGREEATLLFYGDKVPAYNAALLNSYMARALDCDDGIRPGMHVGASAIPTALATSEWAGGCSGKELLTSLVLGGELADRINLVSKYDGFDPTGICSIFASTAIACRILSLDKEKTWHALAIAFNRSGGSFQSNIEGSLSVRLIQGLVAQGAILSAQLASRGFTGPKSFLEGTYGYFHLYARDQYDIPTLMENLGKRFEFCKTMFKKYPSCGDTISSTEALLDLVREYGLRPEHVSKVKVRVTPYAYKLVGGPFQIGQNPRVNAQFNIRYCVANALLRKSSKLEHFEEERVRDPGIMDIVQKVDVEADPLLDERDETAVEMEVFTQDGKRYDKRIDVAAGFAERPLSKEEILERFWNCIEYAKRPLPTEKIKRLLSMVQRLEEVEDIRSLIPHMLW